MIYSTALVLPALVLLSLLPLVQSLQCLHNSTVTNAMYYKNGMLIRAYTSNYDMGVLECHGNLTRCVNFKSMDVSFFNTLDVAAQDDVTFIDLIKDNNGKVFGRTCMSEADCARINAIEADDCTGDLDFSCSCTTDECTGASGGKMTMLSLMLLLVYSLTF